MTTRIHTRAQRMTAEELLELPDDGFRYELVRGELRKMSPAGSEHGMIAAEILGSLYQHIKAHDLGRVFAAETGFKIAENPDTVRAPDVAFVSRERVAEIGRSDGYFPGAPDLAAEVISPNDSYADVQEKVAEWLRAGARMVLVVDTRKRAVMVYRSLQAFAILSESDAIEGDDVVPGWTLPVADLFAS